MPRHGRLPRPYIPVLTRVLVARRQLRELGIEFTKPRKMSLTVHLGECLEYLKAVLKVDSLQLDHDPALEVRERRKNGDYIPPANSHRHLFYRPDPVHLEKTTGRKPGAERTVTSKGSDNWLAKKFRRLEGPKKRKARIPQRKDPWPKNRSVTPSGKRPFR